ncbi:MAG: hypothetical protein J3K34DRAFT_421847 [Monoraphidium minutum]|nr:MAG: hypothetical protein J3K34DRAFT_421847 [Monoraphidium minutum]
MARLGMAPCAPAAYVEVLSRGHDGCAFEQGVPAGSRGLGRTFPGAPPLHRHTHSDETFTVVQGRMGWSVDGRTGEASEGGVISIPKGAVHTFWNAADDEPRGGPSRPDLVVRFTLAPCGGAPAFFENLAGICADAGGRHRVPFAQLVLLYAAHGFELATMPRPVWRLLAAVVPPIARALGYRAAYPEYASAGGTPGGGAAAAA